MTFSMVDKPSAYGPLFGVNIMDDLSRLVRMSVGLISWLVIIFRTRQNKSQLH